MRNVFGCFLAPLCWLWLGSASAQSNWPDYIGSLTPSQSESPVAAVLPADLVISSPAAALAPDRSGWSGHWNGWACRAWACDVKIAVEHLSQDEATIVYAIASARLQPVTQRATGKFVKDELLVRLNTGSQLVLRMRAKNQMEMMLRATDTRLLAAGLLTQSPQDYVRSIRRVPTPWVENGNAQTLEMVVYKPVVGSSPFPTLIVNHGSTGTGAEPEVAAYTWTSQAIAKVFSRKGWQVVFPQRRGRGKSDGVYDEGFTKDRSRYACEPELSLPGVERAMSDLDSVMAYINTLIDVDKKQLMVGGVSRGGILSAVYAGSRAVEFVGVLNFVGGWQSEGCEHVAQINPVLFKRGSKFAKPMLWLYGSNDPFYSVGHSRMNFDAFKSAGGQGSFHVFARPNGMNGHYIHAFPSLWEQTVSNYLQAMTKR